MMPWIESHLADWVRAKPAGTKGPAGREMKRPIWIDPDILELHTTSNLKKFENGDHLGPERSQYHLMSVAMLMRGLPVSIQEVDELFLGSQVVTQQEMGGLLSEASTPTLDPKRGFTDEEVFEAAASYGHRCPGCEAQFGPTNGPVGGHIIAHAKGGSSYSPNCVALCVRCNEEQGTRHLYEFLKWKGAQGARGRIRLYSVETT
jgi:hypothetical protein